MAGRAASASRGCVSPPRRTHTLNRPRPPRRPTKNAQVRQNARVNSRMAYFIKLTPQLNGMTVALGPIEPWMTE